MLVVLIHSLHNVASDNYEGTFEIKSTSRFEFLTGNLSKIVCSIDIKFITICFELNSNPEIVDELFRKTLGCVPNASIEIIR